MQKIFNYGNKILHIFSAPASSGATALHLPVRKSSWEAGKACAILNLLHAIWLIAS